MIFSTNDIVFLSMTNTKHFEVSNQYNIVCMKFWISIGLKPLVACLPLKTLHTKANNHSQNY